MCVRTLRDAGHNVTGYWYNPNIHPYTEYKARMDSLSAYAGSIGLPMIWNDSYGLRPFVRRAVSDLDNRCSGCYEERLRTTAQTALEGGFDAFSTTLLISPYQKHDILRGVAERVSAEVGIPFLYVDFRPLFYEGRRIARSLPLYMQKYCGCIFSEEERYLSGKAK
jgi:predicted adenine nucleotide alpha hydrolase (AANH) superfamily ATPase